MDIIWIVLGVLVVLAFIFRSAFTGAYEEVSVVEVIDGDSIVVIHPKYKDGIKVHLLGIDAPELSKNSLERDQYYARDAAHYVKTRLRNATKIFLEYDKEKKDSWGNLLAYVYLSKSGSSLKSLNAELVAKGYAKVDFKSPNLRYEQSFLKLEAKAQKMKLGIWKKARL